MVTRNLTDKTSIGGNGNGLRHSEKMVITERFKRVAADVIQCPFTVDDPVTYARPFTMSMPLTPLDGGVLLPYECHGVTTGCRTPSAPSEPKTRRLPRI